MNCGLDIRSGSALVCFDPSMIRYDATCKMDRIKLEKVVIHTYYALRPICHSQYNVIDNLSLTGHDETKYNEIKTSEKKLMLQYHRILIKKLMG